MTALPLIGVDLGGTKIEAIALAADGKILDRRRVATPQGDYGGTVRVIASLVAEVELTVGATVPNVGIGVPGAISPATGRMKNANSVCLNGRPLDCDLATAMNKNVLLANDANCFARSEAEDGAGAGAEVVFGVIMGTGVGGGIVVRGHTLTGANAVAGEWGHNPLPWPDDDERPGPDCYCGRRGCVETFLSGPGMVRAYEERSGTRIDPGEIAHRAAHGEEMAARLIERCVNRLARALATVINIVDPDVIVLGGGLSNLDFWYERVPREWTAYVFSDAVRTRLVQNVHGDSSGVRGAAWLARERR